MSGLHGTACWPQCGSFATQLKMPVRIGGMSAGVQASNHSSQGVVDGINESGVSTMAPR